jgi:tetrahydromethanopterin S-methyltransferase subunit B
VLRDDCTGLRPFRPLSRKGAGLPLSEHEQRVLQELEQALVQEDPAFANRVRSENIYRYAGRYLKWSILGFVVGLTVMLVFFTTSVAVGFVGVLIMFASLVVFWTNLHRMGKAGLEDIGRSLRKDGIGNALNDTRTWLRDRFRRNR